MFPSKRIFITSLNKENRMLDQVHSHLLYTHRGGEWFTWRTAMRWAFMSALNVRTLPINCYINCVVMHASLALSPMLEVVSLLLSLALCLRWTVC